MNSENTNLVYVVTVKDGAKKTLLGSITVEQELKYRHVIRVQSDEGVAMYRVDETG